MSAENGQKEKKPFKIKEFFKSTSFKCIAVLLAIVLVCGILLTICNSLFEVTDQERLDRVLSQIYGESVETKEHELTEYETTEFDNGSINNVYEVTSDGNYLISSTGTGGFSGGTVTCWVVIEMTDGSVSGIGNVVVSENTNQSWIANVPDSAFEHFGESYTDGETFDVSDWQDNGLTGGATGSTTAIVNAVNTALLFARSQIAGEVIEPDVNPFEDFDYTEYIDTTATTVKLADNGTDVIFDITTANVTYTAPSSVEVTVNEQGVITDYTITDEGSTTMGDVDFADLIDPDILSGVLFENKDADGILALLGGSTEFTPDNFDDKIAAGATYSSYYFTYAALFAAANYENGYVMALENSIEYTEYIDMESTKATVSGTDVIFDITTANVTYTAPSSVEVTVNEQGVITDYTITDEGSTTMGDVDFADLIDPDILSGVLFENKDADGILALLGGSTEFTPDNFDDKIAAGATYSSYYFTYAALFAAVNYEVYAELAQYAPPAFEYTDYINVDELDYTVENGAVTYKVVTTSYGISGAFTINITVDADGKITAYKIPADGYGTVGGYEPHMNASIKDGSMFIGATVDDILKKFDEATGENGEFVKDDINDDSIVTSASTSEANAGYSNFLCVYAALFATANYQLLGGAEV